MVLFAVQPMLFATRDVTAVSRSIKTLLRANASIFGPQVASLSQGEVAFAAFRANSAVLIGEAAIDLFAPGVGSLPSRVC